MSPQTVKIVMDLLYFSVLLSLLLHLPASWLEDKADHMAGREDGKWLHNRDKAERLNSRAALLRISAIGLALILALWLNL